MYIIKNRQDLLILCVLVPFSHAQQSAGGAHDEPAGVAITAAAGAGPLASSTSAAARQFVWVCVAASYSLNASVGPTAKRHWVNSKLEPVPVACPTCGAQSPAAARGDPGEAGQCLPQPPCKPSARPCVFRGSAMPPTAVTCGQRLRQQSAATCNAGAPARYPSTAKSCEEVDLCFICGIKGVQLLLLWSLSSGC